MNTAIQSAFESAGFPKVTQQQRLWQWFKDHPRNTSTSAAKAVRISVKTAASLAGQLVKRGMLQVTKDMRQPQGTGSKRPLLVFWVPGSMLTYEILPMLKSAQAKAKKQTSLPLFDEPRKPAFPSFAPSAPAPAAAADEMSVDQIIDRLPVRKARELYLALDKLFSISHEEVSA